MVKAAAESEDCIKHEEYMGRESRDNLLKTFGGEMKNKCRENQGF